MHAPAVGRAVADWILTGEPVDLEADVFAPERFAGGFRTKDAALF
jgi:glycine/D-amino acid oxidase-like deaminating enzyme